jgi:uncharacterized membrane protein
MGAGLLALVVWVYRSVLATHSGRWRWAAFALRMVALVMAVAATLRPELVFTETRRQSASLVVLYDRSSSMKVADAWDGLPRWEAMGQTVSRAEESLKRLGELLEIREYSFDTELSEVTNLREAPTGVSTAIGDVLREAIKRSPGRVAGVVLLTDGASRTGTPPSSEALHFKDLGIPIHTVGIGKEAAVDTARDLAFRTITAGPTVFEKNRLAVVGELDARGFSAAKVEVTLRFDGIHADSRTIELPPSAESRTKVELGYVPTVPGEHMVTLEVREPDPKKGELVESNNAISTFVTVLKGGLRVQYLDGGLESFEPRFIRWSLDKSPDIKVDFAWVRDKEAIEEAERDGTLFDRSQYDVVLLRDIQRTWFSERSLEQLRQFVESGGGFAMLGGRKSFGPGGFANSPVAVVLPVTIHPGDQQIQKPFAVRPTQQGLAHFIMRLGSEQQTPRIWESLHPLDGATGFSDVKGQARVLGESPDGQPIIVAQDFGQGRSMAIAGDTTRHWYRQSEQGLRHHRRFWRQVILWLAKKEQAGENRVWLELAKRRVARRESLEVTTGAEDEQGNPLTDAEFSVTVTRPGGVAAPLKVAPQGERMKGTFFATDTAGEYQVSVVARHKGQELAAPRVVRFLVYEDDAELANPAADLTLLAQMSELTGGEFVPPERLPAFYDSLQKKDLHLEIERLTQVRLWDNWFYFLIFVAVMTTEWAIRKWKGLV